MSLMLSGAMTLSLGAGGAGGGSVAVRALGGPNRLIEGFSGGANRSQVSRFPQYSPFPFDQFKVIIPTFYNTGGQLADTLLPNALTFQYALEYPYGTPAAIGPRFPALFGGLNYADYNPGTWDTSKGYIESDWINLGQTIPANTAFGNIITDELPAGTWNNNIPYSWTGTNFISRGICVVYSAGSQIAAKGGASDVALTASSLSALGTTQSGNAGVFTPVMLLVRSSVTGKTAIICGDSTGKGSFEGTTGSSTYGDSWGDLYGNKGLFDRGLFDQGISFVNLSKGSDGYKNLRFPPNSKYRRQLMQLACPDPSKALVIMGNGINDVSQTTLSTASVRSTAYVVGDLIVEGNPATTFVCTTAGTTAASAPTFTGGTNGVTTVADGSVVWTQIDNQSASDDQRVARILGGEYVFNRQVKADLPGAIIIGHCVGPNASSTEGTWTLDPATDQTASSGWGASTSRRGKLNAKRRALDARLAYDRVIDVNPYLEYTYPTETSKWTIARGRIASDVNHPNSNGYDLARSAFNSGIVA